MRVILFKGASAYGALRLFIDDLAVAFGRLGHEPIVIDATAETDLLVTLERHLAAGPIDLVFSFNIFGDARDDRGRSIGDIVSAPHVIQFVDYPLSHLHRLEKTSPHAALLVVDQSHVEAILSTYGPDRFGYVGFSAHGAIGETVSPGADPTVFAADRPIPILFLGTFYKPQAPGWRNMPANVQNIYEAAVEIALANEWTPALDALDSVLCSAGIDPDDNNFAEFRKTAHFVHERVRAHRRFQLLNVAASMGLPLHIFGKGYDEDLHRYKNLTYGGDVDLPAALKLMAQSRVVLNINANFGAGSHERPLSALNAGAAAASDHSSFYASHFKAGEEIALYRWRDLEAGLASIAKLAKQPEAAFAMAQAGQRRTVAEHMWINRVATIVAAAEHVRSGSTRGGRI